MYMVQKNENGEGIIQLDGKLIIQLDGVWMIEGS